LGHAMLAQDSPEVINYDEAKIPPYTLPDPLVMLDGTKVTDAQTWSKRRPEILKLFETQVYGKTPVKRTTMEVEVVRAELQALNGIAERREVVVAFSKNQQGPKVNLLIYIPKAANKPVPAFLGLNFDGNQSIDSDPGIAMSTAWMRDNKEYGIVNHHA